MYIPNWVVYQFQIRLIPQRLRLRRIAQRMPDFQSDQKKEMAWKLSLSFVILVNPLCTRQRRVFVVLEEFHLRHDPIAKMI